jgi:hypothetical protein
MQTQEMQELTNLIQLIHMTDDTVIQEKIKQLVNRLLDSMLTQGK